MITNSALPTSELSNYLRPLLTFFSIYITASLTGSAPQNFEIEQTVRKNHFNARQTTKEPGYNTEKSKSMDDSNTGQAKRAYNLNNKRTVGIHALLLDSVYIRPKPSPSPAHSGHLRKRYRPTEDEAEKGAVIDKDSQSAISLEESVQYGGTVLASERHRWRGYIDGVSQVMLPRQRCYRRAYLRCLVNQD